MAVMKRVGAFAGGLGTVQCRRTGSAERHLVSYDWPLTQPSMTHCG